MTCREAVLAAFARLEARHSRGEFMLAEIVAEVMNTTSAYCESTIRTHVSSRMCANAPDHHATTYDDLERCGPGAYRRRHG